MSLTLLSAPAEEPLTLAEAKAFAKIETGEDDMLVRALILSARLHVEARTRCFLVTQSWRAELRAGTARRLAIPVGPVQALSALRLIDAAGGAALVDPAAYRLIAGGSPGLRFLQGAPSPGIAVELDLVLGFGPASAVPEPLRHAVRLLVAHWYEERGFLGIGDGTQVLPESVERLIAPYRIRAL